jgi:hypothetical protein
MINLDEASDRQTPPIGDDERPEPESTARNRYVCTPRNAPRATATAAPPTYVAIGEWAGLTAEEIEHGSVRDCT